MVKLKIILLFLFNFLFNKKYLNPLFYGTSIWLGSFLLIFIIGLILILLSIFLIKSFSDIEKLSVYECGFEPFETARINIDVPFFLIGLIFLIFDLEIFFIIPFIFNFFNITILGFFFFFIFLIILTLGFIFEWNSNILKWYKK